MPVTVLGCRRNRCATSLAEMSGNFATILSTSRCGPVTPIEAAMRFEVLVAAERGGLLLLALAVLRLAERDLLEVDDRRLRVQLAQRAVAAVGGGRTELPPEAEHRSRRNQNPVEAAGRLSEVLDLAEFVDVLRGRDGRMQRRLANPKRNVETAVLNPRQPARSGHEVGQRAAEAKA